MRKRNQMWIALLAVWMLIGLSFSLNDYWFSDTVEKYAQESLWKFLLWDAIYWPTWAVLAWLLIFRIARRFPPLSRRGWARSLLITVAIGLAFALVHRVIYLLIATPIQMLTSQAKPFDPWLLLYNLPLGFMSYCVILLIKRVADYAFDQKEEAEASRIEAVMAQKDAQMSRLKADLKLQPHFIFNILNSIACQVREDANAADDMLALLGDFLQLTLKYSDSMTVTLEEELKILRSYLAVEKVRLEDVLEVREEIEPQTLAAQVPTFILQPSIENAIKHRQSFERVQIVVAARREDGKLRLQVKDNGDQWQGNGRGEEGFGIKNTRTRLASVYRSGARFELTRAPDGWTVAAFEMPFNTAAPNVTAAISQQ